MNANETQSPLLLSAKELARLLSLSKRQVFRLNSCGKLPKSVRIGGSVRWRRGEIEQWIQMGCPSRQEFEARREAEHAA